MITTTFQLDFRTFKRAPRKTGPKAHWLKQKKTCTPIHPFSVLRLLRRCKSDFYPFQTEEQTETGNSTQRARSHLSQPLLCPRRSPSSLPASSTPAESPPTPPFFLSFFTQEPAAPRRKAGEKESPVFLGLSCNHSLEIFSRKRCVLPGAAVTHRSPADGAL